MLLLAMSRGADGDEAGGSLRADREGKDDRRGVGGVESSKGQAGGAAEIVVGGTVPAPAPPGSAAFPVRRQFARLALGRACRTRPRRRGRPRSGRGRRRAHSSTTRAIRGRLRASDGPPRCRRAPRPVRRPASTPCAAVGRASAAVRRDPVRRQSRSRRARSRPPPGRPRSARTLPIPIAADTCRSRRTGRRLQIAAGRGPRPRAPGRASSRRPARIDQGSCARRSPVAPRSM